MIPDIEIFDFYYLRKKSNFTLRQVEELIGISNAYLSQLENGKIKSPSYQTVKKLLDIYHKEINTITPENIKELEAKYGFELILKEMWVCDVNAAESEKAFVFFKSQFEEYPFFCTLNNKRIVAFKYASEYIKEEQPEPKVGDCGWFWDDENGFVFSTLREIDNTNEFAYLCNFNAYFKNFSTTKQPWMK